MTSILRHVAEALDRYMNGNMDGWRDGEQKNGYRKVSK